MMACGVAVGFEDRLAFDKSKKPTVRIVVIRDNYRRPIITFAGIGSGERI